MHVERTFNGNESFIMLGYMSGSVPPYGYRLNNGKLVFAEDDMPNNVKRISKCA